MKFRYVKWVTLTAWHLELLDDTTTLCGERMPALGSLNVHRIEQPKTELKVCGSCTKSLARGVRAQLPLRYRREGKLPAGRHGAGS